MFYCFVQNNSGGSFDADTERGISHYVIIEAHSATVANKLAEAIGLYFDGCRNGRDCSCCGDRWSEVCEQDATVHPEVYGRRVGEPPDPEDHRFPSLFAHSNPDTKDTFVHYLDGSIKAFDHDTGEYYG